MVGSDGMRRERNWRCKWCKDSQRVERGGGHKGEAREGGIWGVIVPTQPWWPFFLSNKNPNPNIAINERNKYCLSILSLLKSENRKK